METENIPSLLCLCLLTINFLQKDRNLASEINESAAAVRSMNTTMTVRYIPNDIMTDIFLRLPAYSLVRLRWACKYWFNLITRDNDDFIKKHHHCSTHDEIINNNPCVLFKDGNGNLFKRYIDYTYNTWNLSCREELDFPSKNKIGSKKTLLSSFNGLIFYKCSSSPLPPLDDDILLCIWNPCTKEYKVLPKPFKYLLEIVNYGFGYDRTIDDYKVIRNSLCGCGTNVVQIYTLKENSWRTIEPFINNNIGCLQDVGVFMNGALYWISDKGFVISFDIEKEKYQEISKEPDDTITCWRQLKVFEGSLYCLLRKADEIDHEDEMWVMNKETNAWSKLCSIPKSPPVWMKQPLSLNKNRDILMVVGWQTDNLILLDTKKKISMNLNICHGKDRWCSVQEVYMESLVSLKSGTYAGDKSN